MNSEHVKGAIDRLVGTAKEATGQATGNTGLEVEGKADQLKGTLHNVAGDAKDAGQDVIDRIKSFTKSHS